MEVVSIRINIYIGRIPRFAMSGRIVQGRNLFGSGCPELGLVELWKYVGLADFRGFVAELLFDAWLLLYQVDRHEHPFLVRHGFGGQRMVDVEFIAQAVELLENFIFRVSHG